MEIYLVRHGEAVDREIAGIDTDDERWLTERGRSEVTASAKLLRSFGVKPDLALSSPLVRAQQTAEIIVDITGAEHPIVTSRHLIHGGSFAGILEDLREHDNPEIVLLAGHMPSIGRFAGWLCWNDREAAIGMRTGQVARIDLFPERIAPGWGDLRWLIAPEHTQALGIDR